MANFSRRVFIGHLTAVSLSLCALASGEGRAFGQAAAKAATDTREIGLPGHWKAFGRAVIQKGQDSLILQDGFVVEETSLGDSVFSFRARAPQGTSQVQIWAGARCKDRDSRYVFALRGGDNDDMYLARYAPDGRAKFLGIAPLGFHPEPGTWYTLRLVTRGKRFHLYLNDEATPRINVQDADAMWTEGGVSLGSGWLPVEFREVTARPLTDAETAAFEAVGAGAPPKPDLAAREQRRAQQRAAYTPMTVKALAAPRAEISLDGSWLFLPDQELAAGGASPQAAEFDDSKWHVMDVPNFWTPTLSWLHNETGFNELSGVSATKGICDKVYLAEIARLDGYTFAWRDTRSAWYRQHIDLPEDAAQIAGRRFALQFDAIAKVSQIWVNGTKVGGHVGMFGEVNCDITSAVRPGRNVIAVHVVGRPERGGNSSGQVLGVAVTVEVTAAMLNSLPHGMYPNEAGGIWQPVRLIVTQEAAAIADIYVKPRLDGLDCELTIRRGADAQNAPVAASYTIRPHIGGGVILPALYASPSGKPETLAAGSDVLHFSTPPLKPQLWSPQKAWLYDLEVTLTIAGKVADRRVVPFGFRTFTVENGKLMLNGKPFWLRGANHFPNALRPNDRTLARKFMALAREGNVVATRSHTVPFTKTWLQAADEAGLLVSFEGTWPWLMLRGEPPADDLLKAWHEEFAAMIRTHRNHPSVVLWTVNNEMKFPSGDRSNPDLLKRKWVILSDMVKTIRSVDPTRPVVCDSSYDRNEVAKEYADLIQPSGFDDGDVDDLHRYYGWYDESFFHLMPRATTDRSFGKRQSWPGRPLISQEMSTGYPRNDDGHPTRFYLFKHHTPQTMVGDEAYENRDPDLFLKRQAFLTKELAENFRRTYRDDCSGILHFAYVSWFKDVWNAKTIQPFKTYTALQRALQPVLISAELYGRHFYAGTRPKMRFCVANDSESYTDLPSCGVLWKISSGSTVIAYGQTPIAATPYYTNTWAEASLYLPDSLPTPRVNAVLWLRLVRDDGIGGVVSENVYDITLGTPDWASEGLPKRGATIAVFDPASRAPKLVKGPGFATISTLDGLHPEQRLIIAGAEEALASPAETERLQRFVAAGGKVLLLSPGARLPKLFPDHVASYRDCGGEVVTLHVPESPIFDGIEPLDLAWFEQGPQSLPRACRGVYRLAPGKTDAIPLADVVDRHGYLNKPDDILPISGNPLVELQVGSGRVIAGEMMLEACATDPIAGRLLGNLVRWLG